MTESIHTTRRAVLKAAPAALVTAAVPTLPLAETETPVMRLFREWRTYHEWAEGVSALTMSDDDFQRACAGRRDLEERIVELPCENATDILAKLVAITFNGLYFSDDTGGILSNRIMSEAVAAVDGALA